MVINARTRWASSRNVACRRLRAKGRHAMMARRTAGDGVVSPRCATCSTMSDHRLLRILSELSSGGDVDPTSARLCDVCASITSASGAGIMLMSKNGPESLICASGQVSELLDDLQFTLGEALLQHRAVAEAHLLNEQLHNALNSRIAIEQAKGMVAATAGVDMEHAFRRLRAHARNHNGRLVDIAREIVEGDLAVSSLDPVSGVR
jgi:hypothetical protein